MAEGEVKDRAQEKYEIARKLVAMGEDTVRIALATGLSKEEIKLLLGESKKGK